MLGLVSDATHLLVTSFSIRSLLPRSSIVSELFRVHCLGCLLIVFSANPVGCFERCVAQFLSVCVCISGMQ